MTSVLFISDLYLEAERPNIIRAFLSPPDEYTRRAEALYILGDFFEVWIDDNGIGAFRRLITQSLRQVVDGGMHIYLIHGNRDFLIDKMLCRETRCTLLPGPSVTDLYGKSVLLIRGDSLCTRDEAHIHLRRWLYSPFTLWVLRHLPLATRHKLARRLRRESRA